MSANKEYLNIYLEEEAKLELEAETREAMIESRAMDYYEKYIKALDSDIDVDTGKKCQSGLNMYGHIANIPFTDFALLAKTFKEAVDNKSILLLGLVFVDLVSSQILADARTVAKKELE